MSPLTKMFLDSRYQGRREGREEGRKEGQEGKTKEIVQKMLKYKEPENKIIEYTGISKKELNIIKSNI